MDRFRHVRCAIFGGHLHNPLHKNELSFEPRMSSDTWSFGICSLLSVLHSIEGWAHFLVLPRVFSRAKQQLYASNSSPEILKKVLDREG